ncbi:Hypothetical protein SCLAV_1264 [Streptomyces clavuligerus]|uniref:Uncharacterized protein n=1 Tax=Streptomyces clavuligerus TaxID=1901 RepID=E2PZN4_STRCL|nr:Hypothetical protein SCLAV_1264 [Streptomyces clavuligerus]
MAVKLWWRQEGCSGEGQETVKKEAEVRRMGRECRGLRP